MTEWWWSFNNAHCTLYTDIYIIIMKNFTANNTEHCAINTTHCTHQTPWDYTSLLTQTCKMSQLSQPVVMKSFQGVDKIINWPYGVFFVNLICGPYFAVFLGKSSGKWRAIVCLRYLCWNISVFSGLLI